MLHPIRRIVTGHNGKGRSIVATNALANNLGFEPLYPDEGLINLWALGPALDRTTDPMEADWGLLPPKGGSLFRMFQIAPESTFADLTIEQRTERVRGIYEALGAPDAHADARRHPGMHKTRTIDYIILLKGQITLLLDVGEVAMEPFDVVIQHGTNHAWVNRGTEPALLMAVLIDES